MKAVRVVRHGPPSDAIAIEDVEVPLVGPGEALVSVSAASLNFGDIARCRGGVAAVLAEPPFTLGMDVCGVVEAVGDGAGVAVGDRVVGIAKQSLGGLAESALTSIAFPAPAELDDVGAAAFTLPFHLGHLALHERAALRPVEWLLVRSGASAVGTAAIQLGVAAGARVIATAGGPAKTELCASLGAEVVVDHATEDVFDAVLEATGGRGADVIFDPIGGEQTEAIWTCAALGGRYLAIGFNDDPESGLTGRPLRKASMANLTIMGVVLAYLEPPIEFRRFGVNTFPPSVGRGVHEDLLGLVAAGTIRPAIGRVIGPADVAAALEDHEARRTSGRTVVDLSPRVGVTDSRGRTAPGPGLEPTVSATSTETATVHVEIWSDVVCPWCYIGKRRFEEALAGFEHGDQVSVTWRSYQLNPDAPFDRTYDTTRGIARKYGMTEEQAEKSQRKLEGLAETVGLEFHLVGGRGGNTRDAHRLLHLAAEVGLQDELKERLLRAYFTEQRSVFDAESLTELAVEVGLPADRVAEVFADPMLFLDDVVEDIAKAQAYGAGGVPFFVVDGRYGVSGAQAPDVFADVLEQAWKDHQPEPLTTIVGAADGEVCGPDGCEVPG